MHASRLILRLLATGCAVGAAFTAGTAEARCVASGSTTTCDTTPPNPETSPVSNTNVRVLTGAAVAPVPPPGVFDSVTILDNGNLTSDSGSSIRDPLGTNGNAVILSSGATASVSGAISASEDGSRGIVMANGTSLTVNQGGLVFVSGASTLGIRPTKAAISTGQGSNVVIQVNGTVRSLTEDVPAIAGYNIGAPVPATRFGTNSITVGATGLVESTGARGSGIRAGNNSVVTVAGTVRATGLNGSAIIHEGPLTINLLQGGLLEATQGAAIAGGTFGSGIVDLTVAGTINGAVVLGPANDHVTLAPTGRINGALSGGTGTDLLTLTAPTGASGTYDFQAQPVTGFEQFSKEGAGSFTLTGNGSTAAAGSFAVNAGTLVANANLSNTAFTVASGARLTGSGPLGSAAVGGVFAPGTGIATVNLTGGISFAAGSTYEVQANAAGASDRIVAAGAASLGGTVQVLAENGTYAPSTQYLILGAGSVSGTFGSVTSNLAFLTPSLLYNATEVRLLLTRNDIDFAAAAATANQRSTADAIEALGGANPLFIALVGQSAAGARAAFDVLSGEIYPSLAGYLTLASRTGRNALLRAGRDNPDGISLWAEGSGGWSWQDAGAAAGTARARGDSTGIAGGATYRNGGFLVGLALGTYDQDYRVADRASRADVESFFLGGHVGYRAGGLSLQAGYARTSHDADARRDIGFAGYAPATARFDGDTDQMFADVSYDLLSGPVRAAVFAGYAHVGTDFDRFGEAGSPVGLDVDLDKMESDFITVGARVSTELGSGPLKIVPRASLAYQNISGDRFGSAAMRFPGQAASFAIAGAPLPKSAAEIAVGIDLVGSRVRFGLGYDGLIASSWKEHGLRLAGSLTF